jgi:hypothetical protein
VWWQVGFFVGVWGGWEVVGGWNGGAVRAIVAV